jgi:uncharacterized protein YlzI (FlbEa/FlbD family)
MADFIFVHRETGEEILVNRDHIVSAESAGSGLTTIKVTNGDSHLIKEGPAALGKKKP